MAPPTFARLEILPAIRNSDPRLPRRDLAASALVSTGGSPRAYQIAHFAARLLGTTAFGQLEHRSEWQGWARSGLSRVAPAGSVPGTQSRPGALRPASARKRTVCNRRGLARVRCRGRAAERLMRGSPDPEVHRPIAAGALEGPAGQSESEHESACCPSLHAS